MAEEENTQRRRKQQARRELPPRSDAWQNFIRITDDKAKCNSCARVFDTRYGTSSMRKHYNKFHKQGDAVVGVRATRSPLLPPCDPPRPAESSHRQPIPRDEAAHQPGLDEEEDASEARRDFISSVRNAPGQRHMTEEESTQGRQNQKRHKLPLRSDVWNHFTRLRDDHGNFFNQAKCNSCTHKVFDTKYGNSNMQRHFDRFHKQEGAAVGARPTRSPPVSMVSKSFGQSDIAFNSIDSAINNGVLLYRNSWSPAPPPLQRMRTFTKVYKRKSVDRSIDICQYAGYEELKHALARMFGIEGQLEDRQRTGWKLVYMDHEDDILLPGEDPWEEFVNCVKCIRILSPQEVQQMSLDGDSGNIVLSNQACSSSDGVNAWRPRCDQNPGNPSMQRHLDKFHKELLQHWGARRQQGLESGGRVGRAGGYKIVF